MELELYGNGVRIVRPSVLFPVICKMGLASFRIKSRRIA
jgi:hypothetical protein